jgi:SEC-C motif-containing protein
MGVNQPASEPAVKACPCGGKSFAECCEPILKRQRPAATAEALMRSRFTAHVVHDDEHLHRTHLPTMKEPFEPEGNPQRREWTRLVIQAHEEGPTPDSATVEFTAYWKEGDAEHSHIEKAAFKRIDGAWIYTRTIRQGPAPLRAVPPKADRNDPCPCGSGKKYKKCCGK